MDALHYWRLNEELTIEQRGPQTRPAGFEAAQAAIATALLRNVIEGTSWGFPRFDSFGEENGIVPESIDPTLSRVRVESLRVWLRGRGIKSGFFFPNDSGAPDYLDSAHPRYAPKLAAAVRAWMAMESIPESNGKSAKQKLLKWLRENASSMGMTDDEGVVNETGIEEVAKVANWQLTGGAPKTAGS
jgi:hypothetical protein